MGEPDEFEGMIASAALWAAAQHRSALPNDELDDRDADQHQTWHSAPDLRDLPHAWLH